jgi:hypothetical protein
MRRKCAGMIFQVQPSARGWSVRGTACTAILLISCLFPPSFFPRLRSSLSFKPLLPSSPRGLSSSPSSSSSRPQAALKSSSSRLQVVLNLSSSRPQATLKPPSRCPQAALKPSSSRPQAALKPPSSHPQGVLKPPSSRLQATLKPSSHRPQSCPQDFPAGSARRKHVDALLAWWTKCVLHFDYDLSLTESSFKQIFSEHGSRTASSSRARWQLPR